MVETNMYAESKTWNPFVGCQFDCTYCEPSFKRQLKRVSKNPEVWGGIEVYSPAIYKRKLIKGGCELCGNYLPHYHPERLVTSRIPSSPIVFVSGTGDISYCDPKYVRSIFESIKLHKPKKKTTYYFQSKNPRYLSQFVGEYPEGTVLLTTQETNRDKGYARISKAPLPSVRFRDFLALDFPKKVITIEPVIDFDVEPFVDWMIQLMDQGNLEYVWFGFNSKPGQVRLPEPSQEKAQEFVDHLKAAGISVKGKTLRDVKI